MSTPRTLPRAARHALRARPAFAALLATASLVAAATLSQPALAMPGGHGGHHGGPHGEMHGGMRGGMAMPFANPQMAGRLLDSVNATPEQRTQIKALADAAQRDLQAERSAGRQLREQAMTLFAQPTVDARAAEALRQQMLARQDAASKRMTQFMLDVSRVLTPEQRQRLTERMAKRHDMMERHQRERRQLERPQS
jgi:Spy/CpxP family protein refolding chaperone